MSVQINREGGTTMIQLDNGTQLYAAMVIDRAGRPALVVAEADSPEALNALYTEQGWTVVSEINIAEYMEMSQAAGDIPHLDMGSKNSKIVH